MVLFRDVAGNTILDIQALLTVDQFRKGATAPTDVVLGSSPAVPALLFDATNELASFIQVCPINWDHGSVDFICIWALAAAQNNGDLLSVTMDYNAQILDFTGGGPTKISSQITNDLEVTTAKGLAIGDLYSQTFNMASGDANNPLEFAIALACEIHLTNVTGVEQAHLLGACLNYTALH